MESCSDDRTSQHCGWPDGRNLLGVEGHRTGEVPVLQWSRPTLGTPIFSCLVHGSACWGVVYPMPQQSPVSKPLISPINKLLSLTLVSKSSDVDFLKYILKLKYS